MGNAGVVPHWGMLVHPKDAHPKVFCVLHAYFDESGTHGSSRVCVVAGYFATQNQWDAFDRKWRKALQDYRLKEFHATRFWAHVRQLAASSGKGHGSRVSEYRRWGKKRCDRFIERLLSIIESHRIFPVGCVLVMREWSSLRQDERAVLTGAEQDPGGRLKTAGAARKPYFLPFRFSILAAAIHCAAKQRLHCSFDLNDSFSGYALNYFKTMKGLRFEKYRRLGEIFFTTSEEATPVQAADLLAYEWNQYACQRLDANSGPANPSPILSRAIKNMKRRSDCKLFDRRGMDAALRDYRQKRGVVA